MENNSAHINELEQQKNVLGLIELISGPDGVGRIRAACALGRIGDERAVPALIAALHDSESYNPAEIFGGSSAFEELGSDQPIYPVRSAAWDALRMIWSRTVTTFEEPIPGRNPFEVGDIVAQWRDPDSVTKGARWRVLSISKNEVALELVVGIYVEPGMGYRGTRHFPGYIARISSSVDYRNRHPGTKGNHFALTSYKKVKLPSST